MTTTSISNEVAELDVFLAAYVHEADSKPLANVIVPTDDLLTLGVLRRILESLTRSIPTDAPDDAAVERVARRLCFWDGPEGCGCVERCEHDMEPTNIWHQAATIAVEELAALTSSIPPTTAQGEVVQADAIERLGETLYRLSDKLRTSSFLHDQENHSAYEAVVAAFQRLTPAEAPTTTEPSTDDEWAARDLARAIRLKVTSASWREGELIAMCMDALHDHRLAFSHPSCEVERLREALRSARDCITYLGFGRPTDLTSVLSKIDAALSTPETVSLKGDRV